MLLVETQKLDKNPKMLYVFKYAGRYKIGITNNIERRLKQLSCGCPRISCEYHSEFISNALAIESYLHKLFEEFWVGGEWFSFVDLDKIKNTVEKSKLITKNNLKKIASIDKRNLLLEYFYFDDYEKEVNELEKEENCELEKFLQSVQGIDVPNKYSDLIYSILFGANTEELRKKYHAERFESFRKHLSDEQNKKIDGYFSVAVGMIQMYEDYETIKDFLEQIE